MRVIALEEHFVTPELAAYGESTASIAQPGAWRAASRRLADLTEERLPAMDAAGVDVAVLSLNSPGIQAEPDPAAAVNDFLAGVIARHPDRFGDLGSADPWVRGAAAAGPGRGGHADSRAAAATTRWIRAWGRSPRWRGISSAAQRLTACRSHCWRIPVNVSVPDDPNTARSHMPAAVSAAVSPAAART